MNKTKKKKLKMEYKYRKSEMGIFVFECMPLKKSYIGYTNDTKGTINSNRFKLGAQMHRNKQLQNDWDKYGESDFSIQVLEVLPYSEEDEAKIDYTEELKALKNKWIKKMKGNKSSICEDF